MPGERKTTPPWYNGSLVEWRLLSKSERQRLARKSVDKVAKTAYFKEYYLKNQAHLLQKSHDNRVANVENIKKRTKIYRDANKTKTAARDKRYYMKNRGAIQVQHRKYYMQNKCKVQAAGKLYYKNNIQKVLATCKRYYRFNVKKIAVRQKKYNFTHRDRIRAYHKQYGQDHAQKLAIRRRNSYHACPAKQAGRTRRYKAKQVRKFEDMFGVGSEIN